MSHPTIYRYGWALQANNWSRKTCVYVYYKKTALPLIYVHVHNACTLCIALFRTYFFNKECTLYACFHSTTS